MPRVVIVGAGLSGLSLAFRLRQSVPGVETLILDRGSHVGGNIWTERRNGFQVETGPNGFLDTKPSTAQLCRDLALMSRLIPASEGSRKNRYLYWKGQMQALPNSLPSFLTSRLLSLRGKLNLLMERYRRRPGYLRGDESIHAFARRRAGKEVAEVLADAMVTGIHGGDPKLLSVVSAFPRVVEFEKQFGSVMRGFTQASRQRKQAALARGEQPQPPRMWSFREGLRLLVESLADLGGARILKGVTIKKVGHVPGSDPSRPQWMIRGDGKDHWTADAVVLTCHAFEQAAMLADVDGDLAETMNAIPYNAIAVVALGFRAEDCPGNLDGFGYIVPQSQKRDILGVQWCSSIFPDRAPPGMVLWRVLCGGWHRREMVSWDDARLSKAVLAELRRQMKVRGLPVFEHIVRWPTAIPQYTIGHQERVAHIEERVAQHAGLFVGGNAYHGVAMNDCTEQAERLASRIASYLRR